MDDQQSRKDSFGGAQAVVKKKKGISFIWILPIIAAMIGFWLIYKGIVDAPIEVVINFESAEGISADKTKVLYKGIQMGMVSGVALSEDQNTVDVTVEFAQEDKKLLVDTTKFWLVKPRLSLQGISGLSTVLGGDFIGMDPGTIGGKHTTEFTALSRPPTVAESAPGLHLVLTSKALSTFQPGSRTRKNRGSASSPVTVMRAISRSSSSGFWAHNTKACFREGTGTSLPWDGPRASPGMGSWKSPMKVRLSSTTVHV